MVICVMFLAARQACPKAVARQVSQLPAANLVFVLLAGSEVIKRVQEHSVQLNAAQRTPACCRSSPPSAPAGPERSFE